jgi:hypothetical protein
VQLPAQPIEGKPRVLLGLEAVVRVELRLRARDEERRQRGRDGEEDGKDGDELDERVAVLVPGPRTLSVKGQELFLAST